MRSLVAAVPLGVVIGAVTVVELGLVARPDTTEPPTAVAPAAPSEPTPAPAAAHLPEPPPMPPATANVYPIGASPAIDAWERARTIHDLAQLSAKDLRPGWAAATITPGARSGTGTVPGAYIEGETGRFVNPDSATMAMIVEGSWRGLDGVARGQTGSYAWLQSLDVEDHRGRLEPCAVYSPFVSGGTIVYRPRLGADVDQNVDARMVFADWVPKLAARVDTITSFRRLLEHRAATRADLEAALATTDDRQAAVIAYLVVADQHADRRLELAELEDLDARLATERQGWIASAAWSADMCEHTSRGETLIVMPESRHH